MEKKNALQKIKELAKQFLSTEEVVEVEAAEKFKFAIITAIDKWEVEVDAETIEVGTQLHQVGSEGEVWSLSDGEYELEDGSKIQVDSDGIVVMIGGAESEDVEDEVIEDEVVEEVEESTEMADEVIEDEVPAEEVEDEVNEIEVLNKKVEDLENAVAELLSMFNTNKEEMATKMSSISNEPAEAELKVEKTLQSKEVKSGSVLDSFKKLRQNK